MQTLYVELIGTVLAAPKNTSTLQIVLGHIQSLINDTHSLSPNDIFTCSVPRNTEFTTGDTVYIKSTVSPHTKALHLNNPEIRILR